MKFELRNWTQKITDLEIIDDLRTVANNLGKRSLKIRDYSEENGAKYNYQTAKKRFGNWKLALQKAGLDTEQTIHGIAYGETRISNERFIEDLRKVSEIISNTKFSAADYEQSGLYSSGTISKRFGGWNKAKKMAGLDVGRAYNTTTEEFFENILHVWTVLGDQPKYDQMVAPVSKYHAASYANKFGSWRAALEQFICFMNSEGKDAPPPQSGAAVNDPAQLNSRGMKNEAPGRRKEPKIKRTSRKINLRLRWLILKRDNFCCKSCGRSPAKEIGVSLHVDHIIPWSKDGETVVENLATLCETCNLGKSNLAI